MSDEALAETKIRLQATMEKTWESLGPRFTEVLNVTFSAWLEKSDQLATLLNDILVKKGVKIEVVEDDPDMRTGAYYDTKTKVIKLDKNKATPEKLGDNLIWESCNAANGDEFRRQDSDFSSRKLSVGDYGTAHAKTEFKTSMMYASLVKELQAKGETLAPGAIAQLQEIEKKCPGFFDLDPEEQERQLPILEQSFCDSPHDVDAPPDSTSSLTSSDMYSYEKIQGLTKGGAVGLINSIVAKNNGAGLDTSSDRLSNFRKWASAGYTEDKTKGPAHFLQAIDAAQALFNGSIAASAGFSVRMREVALASAGPAMPPYDPLVRYG